jgi:hypothetical protein
LADRNDVVRVGNAPLEAMKRLGWTMAKVVRLDLPPTAWVALAVADNRLGDPEAGSTFDVEALTSVLAALQAEDADLAAVVGYSPNELAAVFGDQPAPAQQPAAPEQFPEYGEDITTEHTCPKCGYAWSGKSGA